MVALRVDLVADGDEDPAELDEAERQRRRELLELDVQDVRLLAAQGAPENARAIDVTLLGSLIVTAGQEVVGAVTRAVVHWLGRRSNRTVKLTIGEDSIELSDVSAEDQHRLIETFLARHAAPD